MSNVLRLTPAQVKANQAKRARERAELQRADGLLRQSGAIEAERKARLDAAWHVPAYGKPDPSPAFEKAFDQVKQVVSEYMDGRKSRSFTLALLCPQSVNHNSMPDGKGGRYLTAEHKQFRHEVAIACYANKVPKLYGTLDVRIEINNPRADACDNFTKPILDALQRAGAIDNDRNVHHLEVTRCDSIPSGSFVITVREI